MTTIKSRKRTELEKSLQQLYDDLNWNFDNVKNTEFRRLKAEYINRYAESPPLVYNCPA